MRAPRGHRFVMAEFRARTARWGGAKRLALEAGVSEAMISRIRAGSTPMTATVAAALGFDLAYVPRGDDA